MSQLPSRLFEAYILDIDGTVCLGENLLPGAREAITTVRQHGKRTIFLSNNTTKTRGAYARHLTELGIETADGDVVNSSLVMIDFLQRRMPAARLHVLGEDALKADLSGAGFTIVDEAPSVDAVIASFDRTFSYRKLQVAFDAIRNGARFFATNADKYRPVSNGGEPDAAAIIAAIEACTSRRCEEVVGKPSRQTVDYLTARMRLNAGDCIIIGDRLETDIQMAVNAAMESALVLTGATSAAMVEGSRVRPTYLLRNLGQVVPPAYRLSA